MAKTIEGACTVDVECISSPSEPISRSKLAACGQPLAEVEERTPTANEESPVLGSEASASAGGPVVVRADEQGNVAGRRSLCACDQCFWSRRRSAETEIMRISGRANILCLRRRCLWRRT